MSVYMSENDNIIRVSNRIAVRSDVFEFAEPITYNIKSLILEDGSPVLWGYIDDIKHSPTEDSIMPMTIFGKDYDKMLKQLFDVIWVHYFEHHLEYLDKGLKYTGDGIVTHID